MEQASRKALLVLRFNFESGGDMFLKKTNDFQATTLRHIPGDTSLL
jgi:hypothetical protein